MKNNELNLRLITDSLDTTDFEDTYLELYAMYRKTKSGEFLGRMDKKSLREIKDYFDSLKNEIEVAILPALTELINDNPI